MDYYLKLMESAVVKQPKIFDYYETLEITNKYEIYRAAFLQMDTLGTYTYIKEDFDPFTFINIGTLSRDKIINVIQDGYENIYKYMSSEDQEILLLAKRQNAIDNYVEKNTYVRMLNGEPPLTDITGDYWYTHTDGTQRNKRFIYPDIHYGVKPEDHIGTDIKKPVHEQTVYRLVKMKIFDKIYDDYAINGYPYLRYLKRKSSYLRTREASAYELLFIDLEVVDYYIYQTFTLEFAKSRRYFVNVLSNEFYNIYHEHYEQMIVIYLLSSALFNTILKFSNSVSEIEYTDVDVMKAYMKSVGIDYVEMPTMYMNRLIERINEVVAHKGSKKVLVDLCQILDVSNVYRYVLKKTINTAGDFDENTPAENKFGLVLHKIPVTEQSIQNFISTETTALVSFDEVAFDDPYFGSNRGEIIKNLKGEQFSHIPTKYIAVENAFELTSITYKMCAMLRVIINNYDVSSNPLKGKLTYKRQQVFDMTLFDSIMYLIYLIIRLRNFEDVIPDTTEDIRYVIGYNNRVEQDQLNYYKRYYKKYIPKDPLHFVLDYVDVSGLVDDFKNIADASKVDFFSFISYLNDNEVVVSKLEEKMYQSDDYEEFSSVRTFLDNIRICKSVKEAFMGHTTYSGYLKERNGDLYQRVVDIIKDDDEKHTMLKEEVDYISALIIYTMDGYSNVSSSTYVKSLSVIKTDYVANFNEIIKKLIVQVQSLSVEMLDSSSAYKIADYNGRFAMFEQHILHSEAIDNQSIEQDIEFYKHDELTLEDEYTITNRMNMQDETNGSSLYKED